ncbi:tyrosine-type recombinase/integrase [Streptomyces olivoreticuli]|uniref:tyrosine-type recombinase/integrase n=1 Tax=Streptomyces olivoreticuli TaxID=68246 RepID=UPI0013C3715B|nr:tyrosine-type recombinase/integrase [Streptomyces olivoreticuli]
MPEISYYRRCTCRAPKLNADGNPILKDDGKPRLRELGASCPDLTKKNHGSWYFFLELEPDASGERRRVRRGGHRTKGDAEKAADKIVKDADQGVDVLSNETVGDFLARWLKSKRSLARTTSKGYQEHIDLYLIPHLGRYRLRDLRTHHIDQMYDAIQKENAERLLHHARVEEAKLECAAKKQSWQTCMRNTRPGSEVRQKARRAFLDANAALKAARKGLRKITSAATLHSINRTLSSALGHAVKRQLVTRNWAALVELPPAKRPKALVWTDERVQRWLQTGERPSPVMVWTPEQTGRFLDLMVPDRLYPLWHIFVFLGLRRGEACALTWSEIDLDNGWLRVSAQIVEVAYRIYAETPKADSVRSIRLSEEAVEVLREWRAEQERERAAMEAAGAWAETGFVFTQENGEGFHPDWLSRRFKRLVEVYELPPVRLHDLRHGSATLALIGGADIKVVQERLGHSSRQITSDTYTSVVPQLMRAEAEATVAVVPRAAKATKPTAQEGSPKEAPAPVSSPQPVPAEHVLAAA